jgi:hypothetical protein
MKKLDKATLASRDEILARLQTQFSDLEAAVQGFNTVMEGAWAAVEEAMQAYNAKLDDEWGNGLQPVIETYNEAVADANAWKQDVAAAIQEYMDERSDKWQQSEAAERYSTWRDEFDHEFDSFNEDRPEDLSIEQPDEIGFEIDDIAELMEQLPEELETGG